jgi:hypothetical protein
LASVAGRHQSRRLEEGPRKGAFCLEIQFQVLDVRFSLVPHVFSDFFLVETKSACIVFSCRDWQHHIRTTRERSWRSMSAAPFSPHCAVSTPEPFGVGWAINHDISEVYQQRLELLLKNAFFGLLLVPALYLMIEDVRSLGRVEGIVTDEGMTAGPGAAGKG